MAAAADGNVTISKLLLSHGADPQARNEQQMTAVDIAQAAKKDAESQVAQSLLQLLKSCHLCSQPCTELRNEPCSEIRRGDITQLCSSSPTNFGFDSTGRYIGSVAEQVIACDHRGA